MAVRAPSSSFSLPSPQTPLMMMVFLLCPPPQPCWMLGDDGDEGFKGLQDGNVPIRGQLPALGGRRLQESRGKTMAREMAG